LTNNKNPVKNTLTKGESIDMGGRFGKYGDLKRKAALRKSRMAKRRLQKQKISDFKKQRKAGRNAPKPD
jgi:hypothetical protein